MRKPSTAEDLLAWHTAALSGDDAPIHDGLPQAGWYWMQRVKNGPRLPCVIWCDREIDEHGELATDETMRIEIDGQDGGDAAKHWTFLRAISREQFNYISDERRISRLPANKPINLALAPTPPSKGKT